MKKSRLLLIFLYSVPLSILVLVAWWLFSFSYSEFTAYLAASLQKPEWEKFIRIRFTSSAFTTARWVIILLMIIYLLAGFYILRMRSGLLMKCDAVINATEKKIRGVVSEFKSMPFYARCLFFLLLVFVIIKGGWYIINWPLQYDEAWTYNYYIGNSFWQSFLLPHNNHILFTATAWFFKWLPVDPQISIRLPNLIAGVMLVIFFFFFIKRYFSIKTALFSTCWLATCSPVVFYMLYARGYLFILLFTLIALWLQIILVEDSRRKLIRFALLPAIVFGYWSNPVFLYPHAAIGLTMIIWLVSKKDWKSLWQSISIHILSVLFVVVLYLPTLLSSHIYDLMNVGVNHSFDISFFWKPFYNNAWFIFGFHKGYFILASVVLLFFLASFLQKRFEPLQWFVAASIFILSFFSVLQSLPLAGHITIFFSISMAVMLAFIFRTIEMKMAVNKTALIVLLASIASFNSVTAHRHHWFNWSVSYDKSAKKIAGLMVEKNIKSCYLTVNYYKPHLEYYYKIRGRKLVVSLPDSISQDYRDFKPGEEEMVIIRNNKPTGLSLTDYKEFYKDETITAFIRKDLQAE